jgi:glycosyltransferase involved in cell wall biosynthesis
MSFQGATLSHPFDEFTFNANPEMYLAFLGRMSPEKGVERAVEVARLAGIPLKIAGKIYPEERAYFDDQIAPLLRQSSASVEFTGELGGAEKTGFLGEAQALLFPIDWPEPFGLVMIEAMACGTPTIAWRRGSVPEVINDGVTGFGVDTVDDAARAVSRIDRLDRTACRRVFEARFDATRMAREYVQVYRALE